MDPDYFELNDISVGDITVNATDASAIATIPVSFASGISYAQENEFDDSLTVEGKLTLNGEDVGATLNLLKERFLILEDDFKKHEQYPALKDAYEKYKLVEALIR